MFATTYVHAVDSVFNVFDGLLAAPPVGPIVGVDAMKFGVGPEVA